MYDRESYTRVISEISASDFIEKFSFKNSQECQVNDDYFIKIITKYGQCTTFNLVNGKDICYQRSCRHLTDSGYVQSRSWYENDARKRKNYPLKTYSGAEYGLQLQLNIPKENFQKNCNHDEFSYKILIHPNNEYPFEHKSFDVSVDADAEIKIYPKITSIAEDLIKVGVRNRQCYLKDEKKLKNFLAYTKSNCKLECIAEFLNKTKRPFFIPYLYGDGSVDAVFEPAIYYHENYCKDEICSSLYKTLISSDDYKEILDKCKCLHPCDNVQYEFEIEQNKMTKKTDKNVTATIKIYFDEEEVTERIMQYTIDENDLTLPLILIFVVFILLLIILCILKNNLGESL